jgi:integrase
MLGPPRLNTTLLRLAVIAKAHQLKQLPNPLDGARVRELIKRVRRAYAARGARPNKKKAVPKDLLQAMLATCDDSLVGIRDRALLLFAWASGGRRRSEVAAATIDNLERLPEVLHEDGRRECRFIYRLAVSKTNQDGESDPNEAKPIVGPAADALEAWLKAAKISSGKLFRAIRRGKIGKSLSAHSVALIVKARAHAAGLEGDFSGHSLRSGFITEAGRQAKPLADVMRLSGHRSVPQALAYYQGGDVLHVSTANLLGEPEP